MSAYKIAIVQDEFTHTRLLCEFLNEFSVNHVFSVAPPSEIPLIYRYLENKNIKFSHYLTGYLSNTTIRDANESAVTLNKRGIDIGYRANYNRRYSLGEHGYLKYKVAEEFQKISMHHNFNADIATDSKESKKGKEWFKFLGNCKYTIGAESGASVLDESGNIIDSVKKYIAENPNADFFETRKKLFADKEGELKLFALGPRNLEACATKTVQILIEGNYNSVLLPWKHYIPIKRDFSNLEEIIKIIKDDKLRYEIAGNAYRDIVESGNYSIKNYVKFFFNQFHIPVSKSTITGTGFFYWNFFRDKCCWIISYIAHHIWKIVEPITSK